MIIVSGETWTFGESLSTDENVFRDRRTGTDGEQLKQRLLALLKLTESV
jgi:hypothetical protein